jgi:hypothetical protein
MAVFTGTDSSQHGISNITEALYGVEVFARKVFIGGLPIDVTEG